VIPHGKVCPTVNIDRLWSLIPEETRKQFATDTKKAPIIDVGKAGYFKLLHSSRAAGDRQGAVLYQAVRGED